jgi:PKD repeat protein
MISGTSYSDFDPSCIWKSENNSGPENLWIVAIDSGGNKLWDKTVLTGYAHAEVGYAVQLRDGCYIFADDGDALVGNEKTDNTYSFDYWLIKFCDTTAHGMLPVALFTSSDSAFCEGVCVNFSSQSLNATSYSWNFPGGNPSSDTTANPQNICYYTQGNYDVTLTVTNNFGTDVLTVTNTILVYPPVQFSPITQHGDTLFSVQGYSSYAWFAGSTIIPGANNYYYVVQHDGDYSVQVTDSNGCSAVATIIDVISGVNSVNSENHFSVSYTGRSIIMRITSDRYAECIIFLTDETGKLIYTGKISLASGDNVGEIEGIKLSPGIYNLSIQNEALNTKRFIVQ